MTEMTARVTEKTVAELKSAIAIFEVFGQRALELEWLLSSCLDSQRVDSAMNTMAKMIVSNRTVEELAKAIKVCRLTQSTDFISLLRLLEKCEEAIAHEAAIATMTANKTTTK